MNDAGVVADTVARTGGDGSDEVERRPLPPGLHPEAPPGSSPYLLGLFLIGLFIVLYFARAVFLPLVLALFLALLLYPVVSSLTRFAIPSSLGAASVVGTGLVVIVLGASYLVEPASRWIEQAPTLLERLGEKLSFLRDPLENISEAGEEVRKATEVNEEPAVRVKLSAPSLTDSVLSVTGSFLSSFLVTIILLYFLLSSGDRWLRKLVELAPRIGDKKKVIELATRVQTGISTYLLSITMINCCLGVLVALSLWLIGMPSPLLWGALAAALNFIPYLGAFAGVAIVGAVALVSLDDIGRALLAAGVYGTLTVLEGSLITPVILGRRLDLNPVAIFVVLIFWAWLWGIVGALLAVPILASFKLCCDHVERLHPIGRLLTR